MPEQMVETRSWKAVRGLVEGGRYRVCNEQSETIEHLVAGCKVLANSEYLSGHNRALMILAVEWEKEYDLIGMDMVWYKERWEQETVLENGKAELVWDFEFHLQKTTTVRRPDIIFEEKGEKHIWICENACPRQHNLETKWAEKLTKYRQLAFEMRERRPGYMVMVIPVVIGALSGGIKKTISELSRLIMKRDVVLRTVSEIQKTILIDREYIIRKVMLGLVQGDED